MPILDRQSTMPPGGLGSPDEEAIIEECLIWIAERGLPPGEVMYELTSESGEALAVLDLAWPNGLQEGLSQPVALLIDEGPETEEAANQAGYRFFTSIDEFRAYVFDQSSRPRMTIRSRRATEARRPGRQGPQLRRLTMRFGGRCTPTS